MSHFTVMVIGDEPEKQLAPFQENNMGNCPESFLTFENVEEEHRENYETDMEYAEKICPNRIEIEKSDFDILENGDEVDLTISNTINCYIDLDQHSYYYFYSKEKKSRNMIVKIMALNKFSHDKIVVHTIKSNIVKVPIKDLMSWDQYMTEYCGYVYDEEQKAYGNWANENAKWDWYQLGGRWNGYFKTKSKDPSTNIIGEGGVFGDSRNDFVGRADQTKKANIDIEAMRIEEAETARRRYKTVARCFGGSIPKIGIPWSQFLAENGPYKDVDWDERRKIYHSQPALVEIEKIKNNINSGKIELEEEYKNMFHFLDLEDYDCTEDEYAQRYANGAIVTFAIVKDGQWYEKGVMGWWASVSNETDTDEWNSKINEMFDALPDDTLISVFDCHI